MTRPHGGPDARGPARWDFSTNANACGPCPHVLVAIHAADASRYPDPQYRALRDKLAQWHGVDPARLLFAASASEFIMRITAVSARLAPGAVAVPCFAYGDYAAAAKAFGRPVMGIDSGSHSPATLVWQCDPSSPLGQPAPPLDAAAPGAWQVLDCAYAPLRLEGASPWRQAALDSVFQLHSPNKALGLTGIRGAYAIAPDGAQMHAAALEAAAPSWPLGAHALAMLDAWPDDAVQHWLTTSRASLREWKAAQLELFASFGCEIAPSITHFFCARPSAPWPLAALRERGIALRDCASFGRPGWLRASVQPPAAQQALGEALFESGGVRRPKDQASAK